MLRNSSEEAKVRKIYKKLAPMIVADAAKNNIKLDYSIASLRNVDRILESLHKEYEVQADAQKGEEESYHGYAEMLGCYILAVVDKNKIPGKLSITEDAYGTAIGFTFSSGAFSDFNSWCYKAILNGKDDAISPKFQFFVRQLDGS